MNTKILQKCVDALNTESPDLSYVRGMLETLIDMDTQYTYNTTITPVPNIITPIEKIVDEDQTTFAQTYAIGPIGNIHD